MSDPFLLLSWARLCGVGVPQVDFQIVQKADHHSSEKQLGVAA